MSVKLLTEHHLEVLSLKGGCTGSTESIRVKMPHCWKSHAAAHLWNRSETCHDDTKWIYFLKDLNRKSSFLLLRIRPHQY